MALLILPKYAREVARIILYQHQFFGAPGKRAEHVGPVVDIEQPDAVASDQAPFAGEEVQEKSFRVCWLPRLAPTPVQPLHPGLDRRPLQSGMDRMVVDASDLQRQRALQFCQGEPSCFM
jgi:hypothetical protein